MSNPVITSKGYIGIAKQANKGSVVNTPQLYIKYLEEGFQSEHETMYEREGGDGEFLRTAIKNLHREKFSFKMYARAASACIVLAYLLGEDSKTGTGDPYTHTLIRNITTPAVRDWLTIRRLLDTGFIQVLYDAKIESITIEMEAGKPVIFTVEGTALSSFIDTTVNVPVYETMKPFVFYHGDGAFKVETGINTDIKKVTVKITITSQDGLQTDSILLADLPDLKLDIDVSLEFYNNAMAFFKKSVYNNQTTPQETVYSGAFEFDLKTQENVADDRELKITIPKFFWQPVTGINLKGEPEAMVTALAGVAAIPAAGEIITVVCKNDLDSNLT
ncbi:MAG: hypothetical protein V3U02_12915 [Calditrichia bacterium]